jgi:hypothetical protein
MEPLLPDKREALEDLARDVLARSSALGGQLHPLTQKAVADLLRIVNSLYSNLIEGTNSFLRQSLAATPLFTSLRPWRNGMLAVGDDHLNPAIQLAPGGRRV